MVVGFKKGSNIWFIGNVAEGGNVSSASFEIIKPFGGMNEVIGVGIDLARSDGEGNVFRVETICCDGAGVGARCDFVGTIRQDDAEVVEFEVGGAGGELYGEIGAAIQAVIYDGADDQNDTRNNGRYSDDGNGA